MIFFHIPLGVTKKRLISLVFLLNKGDEELKENKILTSDENDDLDLFSNDDDEDELFDF